MNSDTALLAEEMLTAPSGVAVIAGAGISIPAPTCLPSGHGLTEAALRAVSGDFVREVRCLATAKVRLAQELGVYVGRRLDDASCDRAGPLPRPEAIFQAYASVAGPEIVRSLEFMGDAAPNLAHRVLGALRDRGSAVVTTNFDRLIEACSGGGEVLHLHGDVKDPSSIQATIDGITQPFSTDLRDALENSLRGKRLLLVLGYSGGDAFDVSPALASIAETAALQLVWVQHGSAETPLDRGAHQLVSDWPGRTTVIKCNTFELVSRLAARLGLQPPMGAETCPERGAEWWQERFLRSLQQWLPDERSRAVAALAVIESLHLGRFTRKYRHHAVPSGGLTLRQQLAIRRSDARAACARGDYRRGLQITREALRWLKWVGGSDVDLVEQRLLLVMNLRNFGQGDPFTYLRSVPALIRAHAWVRAASDMANQRLWGRLRTHVWTDWVQLLWSLKLKPPARALRTWALQFTDWDAEHRARLLVSDDAGKSSREALDFHYDLEIPPGVVNAGRAKVENEMLTAPTDELARMTGELLRASRTLGDVVGYGKNLLLLARIHAQRNKAEAVRCWRKARWSLSRVRVSVFTRLMWSRELFRVWRQIRLD